MVDFFLVLMLPGGGDELQGIKKGIVELADAIVINKADGSSENLAAITQRHYAGALSLLKHPGFWQPEVTTCSALKNQGIDAVWRMIESYREQAGARGAIDSQRAEQNLAWMRQLIDELLRARVRDHPAVKEALAALENDVRQAVVTPLAAASEIVRLGQS